MDECEACDDEWEKEVKSEESSECGVVYRESASGSFD